MVNVPNSGVPITGALKIAKDWYQFLVDLVRLVDTKLPAGEASDQETATSTTVAVTPAIQQRHPSASKFWAYVTVSAGTPTLQSSYNVTSITDTATGQLTVTIATDFSSANWVSVAGVDPGVSTLATDMRSKAAGSILVTAFTVVTPAFTDPSSWNVVGFGDQ